MSLVELFPNYSKDQLFAFILSGSVWVNEELVKDHTREIKKDSTIFLYDEEINQEENEIVSEVRFKEKSYVSRGAEKILPVLKSLETAVAGKVWMDVGSATGGFTQALLSLGAEYVHAIDLAYNLLDYRLRIDSRVVLHERTNIFSLVELEPKAQCAVLDLSFRSLRGVARYVIDKCEEAYILALCKPQFEYAYIHKNAKQNQTKSIPLHSADLGKDCESFDGVLLDTNLIRTTLKNLFLDLAQEQLYVKRMIPAAIKGRKGNQEYFIEIVKLEDRENSEIHISSHVENIIGEHLGTH